MEKSKPLYLAASHLGSQRNLNGMVAMEIGHRIIQGYFEPEKLLPDESSLAAEFGVSRTVVREAVKALSAKGLVETRPRRGTIVLPVKFWNRLDTDMLAWQESTAPDYAFLQKLTEVRQIVEPPAAELAALRATKQDVRSIQKAYDQLREGLDNVDLFIQADIRFHSAILEATQNELLQPIANVIRVAMRASLRVTNLQADKNRDSLPLHQEIFDAIRKKDGAAAGGAMRRHLKDTWARIEKKFREKG